MKKLFALFLSLIVVLSFCACDPEGDIKQKYVAMSAIEQIDFGSGKYTNKVEVSDERIIEILNSGDWLSENVCNGGYDFNFIIDGRKIAYNTEIGNAVENGKGMNISGEDKQYILNLLIELFGNKSVPQEPTLQRSVLVVSGENRVEPKSFISSASYSCGVSEFISNEVTVDHIGCREVYDYNDEQLHSLPTVTLAGNISTELSENTRLTHVIIMGVGSRKSLGDLQTTLEELSNLGAGEYCICLGTITEEKDCRESYSDVFRLIIE